MEEKLRGLGFGYRARYIAETARHITTTHPAGDWLGSLRQRPYSEARAQLLKLTGVGPKVHLHRVPVRDVGKVQYIDPNRYIIARYSVSRSMGCI